MTTACVRALESPPLSTSVNVMSTVAAPFNWRENVVAVESTLPFALVHVQETTCPSGSLADEPLNVQRRAAVQL